MTRTVVGNLRKLRDSGKSPTDIRGFNFDESDLTDDETQLHAITLDAMRLVFATSDIDIGSTRLTEHVIDLRGAVPIRQHGYRTSFAFRDQLQDMVDEMLAAGVIEPSNSLWASPILLVDNTDGLCVDYPKVNAVTRKDAYPLPRIDELLETLNCAQYFSTLDLQSGFRQVKLDEASRAKPAFTCFLGVHEFTHMPFRLTNAPATFQRLMNELRFGWLYRNQLSRIH